MCGGLHCDYKCNPSLAIVKTWQGLVEVALRSALVLFALGAIVPAALIFTIGSESLHEVVDNIEREILELTIANQPVPGGLREFADEGNTGTLAAGGLIFGIAIVTLLYHVTEILLRFHVTCFNDFPGTFLLTDILLNLFLAAGYFAGGVTAAVFSNDLNDLISDEDRFEASKIRDSLAAGAAFAIFNAVLCVIHAIYMTIFTLKRWNEKVGAS